MDQNEQTLSAFSAPNRRDVYLKARAETPEQKGLSYTDLLFDNIFGLDNEYESTGETIKKALAEDPYGTVKGMATSAYEGAVDFARNPYEGVKGIVEDTASSVYRVATEDLDEKLNRMYGVSYEEATPEQVTKAREVVASDVMTAAGVIPGVGIAAKGATRAAKVAVDALPEAAQAARKFIADESGSLPLGKSVPASRQKISRYLEGDKPQGSLPSKEVGTKRLGDIFQEDFDNIVDFPSEDNPTNVASPLEVGYAPNLTLHDLAYIKLGWASPKGIFEGAFEEATPDAIDYVTSRLQRLDNDPEFNDYVENLRKNPDFAPFAPTPAKQTTFRSAIPEVAALINFPKNGLEGYQLVAELQKNPSLRKAELDTVLDAVDPKARYSKEEALDLINRNTWNVTVEKTNKFPVYQRQTELLDPEIEYFEYSVDAKRPNNTFSPNSQHFKPSTLTHTRGSFRTNEKEGYDYTLIEEKQTDLLQKGFKPPQKSKPQVSPKDVVDKQKQLLTTYDENDLELLKIIGEDRHFEFFDNRSYINFIKKIGPENLMPGKRYDEVLRALNPEGNTKASEDLLGLYANFKMGKDVGRTTPNSDEAWDYYDNLKDTYYNVVDDKITYGDSNTISAPPIKKIEESIRLTMDTLIAESAAKGITRIVMPPFERIVDKRFPKDEDPEGYAKALDPSSGFYKTYVTSFKKYLKEKQEEVGQEKFNWRLKDLNYEDPDYLPTTGTEIDFTGLFNSGYDLSRPALAEGGMVEEEQMNRLMQQGGMADDGMSREPVTGNNIPPGALASEVRDDVDAKLSGGEYVVPADVLRYYGVRFFEDLRSQAKQGMMEMESAGRIGGVPVDPRGVPMQGQDEELTPEEEQMLAQAMSGMAEGGMAFNRGDFTMDSNAMTSQLYFNPTTGKKQTINFLGGQPLGGIPDGFVPWTQALQDTYNATKPATPESKPRKRSPYNDDDNQSDPAKYDAWVDQNYDAITSNPYQFGMDALKKSEDYEGGLSSGLLGIVTGRDKDIQNIANANASLKLMEAEGKLNSPEYKALAEEVKKYVSGISFLERTLVMGGVAATGNGYYNGIKDRMAAVASSAPPATTPPAPPSATPPAAPPAAPLTPAEAARAANRDPRPRTLGSQNSNGNDSVAGGADRDRLGTSYNSPNRDRQSAADPKPATPAPTPTPTSSQGGSNTYSSSTYGSGNASYTQTPRPGSERFAEGGLVAKPKKPRAKTKGLAGKQ
jgi:hypothetical protein